MSIQAMVWALDKAPVDDPQALLVVVALANHADEDGRAAWPTQDRIAARARCSSRTVKRKLAELEATGVIVRGDQQLVAHYPANRRPVVWDLAMHLDRRLGGQAVPPATPTASYPQSAGQLTGQAVPPDGLGGQPESSGGTPETVWGDTGGLHNVLEPSKNRPRAHTREKRTSGKWDPPARPTAADRRIMDQPMCDDHGFPAGTTSDGKPACPLCRYAHRTAW